MNTVTACALVKERFAGKHCLWMRITAQELRRAKPVPLEKVEMQTLQTR